MRAWTSEVCSRIANRLFRSKGGHDHDANAQSVAQRQRHGAIHSEGARPVTVAAPSLSIIIPVLNEEGNVVPLLRELHEAASTLPCERHEVLLVDDGSTDATFERAKRYIADHPDEPVRVVRFRRNFGQTAALAAGFRLARGELFATLDGDLQNDPRDIAPLLAKMDEGLDVVCGWRRTRSEGFVRHAQSRLAASVIGWLTGVRVHDFGCTLRVYQREIARDLDLWGKMHRFIPALCDAVGARVGELEVNHRPRRSGTPKYGVTGLRRASGVALDLLTLSAITRHRANPVRVYGWWALVWVLGAGVVLALANIGREHEAAQAGLVITMLLGGLLTLSVGVQTEITVRSYMRGLGQCPGRTRETIASPGWQALWDDAAQEREA